MRILLLGGTGRTGKLVLENALNRGHIIHALVRDKRHILHGTHNVIVYDGAPTDKAALAAAMQGCEAVLSVLNISRKYEFPWSPLRAPKDFLSMAMKNVVELSAQHHIRRVVFISAWGVYETKKDLPGWFLWLINNSTLRYQYRDHERQEDVLKNSALNWTAVRPVFLTNSKKKKEVIASEDGHEPNLYISRENVAAFILEVLEKNLYLCGTPVVFAR